MSITLNLAQQLKVIDSKADRQYAYENFAYDCRDLALTQADQGNFEEAFNIISWIRNEGLEPQESSLMKDCYVGVAKAIIISEKYKEASFALKNKETHVKALESVTQVFQEPDASKLRAFLKFC
jgi:hypothetical protein